ncbi:l-amino acid oxidase [Paramyrothecium foliicola]|nr:l-amino acid oxidase [Paramyrothecium foliicola]
MKWPVHTSFAAGLFFCLCYSTAVSKPVVHIRTDRVLDTRIANVHIDYKTPLSGSVTFTYDTCSSEAQTSASHVISRVVDPAKPHRLIWVIPRDVESHGCLSAWDESGQLLGRSDRQDLQAVSHINLGKTKRSTNGTCGRVVMTNETGFNVWGPWFDGVALLESKDNKHVDDEAAKAKSIAIVGAGMGGLMTYLVLKQAGLSNVTVIEGSNRLGGRVRTEYLSGGPGGYSYQEMGPMRIPQATLLNNTTYNLSDQAIVFQVIEELNRLNKAKNPESLINLIPFISSSPNGLAYYQGRKLASGLPPTQAQVAADPSLGAPQVELPDSAIALRQQAFASLPGQDFLVNITNNMWQAHADFLKDRGPDGLPGDQWSEFAYLVNYLKGSVTDANAITSGIDYNSYLNTLYYSVIFSPTTSLKTIDGGMNRLPEAFLPLVDGHVEYGKKLERVQFDKKTRKLTLGWRGNYTEPLESRKYDYAVIATPFTVVQRMRLPSLPFVMRNAINTLSYESACKVALEYRTRFWEHLDNPIYGSCSTTTDIPGIGSVCYPSYNINGTGPATILASYEPGQPYGVEWAGVPEEQHVQYVIDAMAEIHGKVAIDEYTGKYSRICWTLDELASGGWAAPIVGNHETYLPEYFKTHSHMIFVGEHTSHTHAWIASALESGLRGGVQLLLGKLGLIDEAKDAVEKWLARWINV